MADLEPIGNGWFIVRDGDRRWRIALAVDGDTRWVFLDGQVAKVPATIQPGRTARAAGAGRSRTDDASDTRVTAPMPATVVTLHAVPGQRVSTGDVVIVLEAMKMELAVHAPREGIITAVHCAPGDLVQPGVALLELA